MIEHLLNEIRSSNKYQKLFVLLCNSTNIDSLLQDLVDTNVSVINVGYNVAEFIAKLDDYSYLEMEVEDCLRELLDGNTSFNPDKSADIIAVHNLGILLEERLSLNPVSIIKNASKNNPILIIWDGEYNGEALFHWSSQKDKFFLDFSDSSITIMPYEV